MSGLSEDELEVFLNISGDYPSLLRFDYDGSLREVTWSRNKKIHRDNDLPAKISYNDDDTIWNANWYKNGALCRENDLPSFVFYHENGSVSTEYWTNSIGPHRVSGPSSITYNNKGKKHSEDYYLDGFLLDVDDWLKDSRVIDHFRGLKNKTSGNLISDVSL